MDRRWLAAMAAVLACAVLPWMRGLDYPFLHDDNRAIVSNPLMEGGRVDPGAIFSSTGWGDVSGYRHVANYRPIPVTANAITRHFFGLNPLPYRLISVAVYGLLCLMLLGVMRTLKAHPLPAALAGAWFALHGTHVETVMFVVNREILLASCFYLAGMHIVIRRSGLGQTLPTEKFPRYTPITLSALALVTFAGLLSKESAATMPLAAAAVVVLARRPGTGRAEVLAPLGALATGMAGYFAVRLAALGRMSATVIPWQDNPLVLADSPSRIAGAMKVLVEAGRLIVAPLKPTVDYGFDVLGLPGPPPGAPPAAIVGGSVIIAAALAGTAYLIRRRSPAWPGLVMAMLSYGLVSSIVFPSWIILGERLLTEPSVGIALALAVGLTRVTYLSGNKSDETDGKRTGSRMAFAVTATSVTLMIAWIALQAVVTIDRVPDFASARTLFSSSLANRPGSTRLHNNLGLSLMDEGRYAEAEPHLRAAIRIDPANAEAHNNLGIVLGNAGMPGSAAAEFAEALKHRPGMISALTNMCTLLVSHDDFASAEKYCEMAKSRGSNVDPAIEKLKLHKMGNVQ